MSEATNAKSGRRNGRRFAPTIGSGASLRHRAGVREPAGQYCPVRSRVLQATSPSAVDSTPAFELTETPRVADGGNGRSGVNRSGSVGSCRRPGRRDINGGPGVYDRIHVANLPPPDRYRSRTLRGRSVGSRPSSLFRCTSPNAPDPVHRYLYWCRPGTHRRRTGVDSHR